MRSGGPDDKRRDRARARYIVVRYRSDSALRELGRAPFPIKLIESEKGVAVVRVWHLDKQRALDVIGKIPGLESLVTSGTLRKARVKVANARRQALPSKA
ncbi:MAG: hypothetical protein HZB92_08965 [Euryarchaeota archaeon]|nr:hypothetical protein [Euryarchaeota archaeon]